MGKLYTYDIICETCGETVTVTRSRKNSRYCSKSCASKAPRKYKNINEQEIIDMYQNGLSLQKIEQQTSIKIEKIRKIIHQIGIMRSNKENSRKYHINHDYFETIDTEHKAYWLGFIYADGYIAKRKGNQKCIGIALSRKDEDHIKNFLFDVDSNYVIRQYTGTTPDGKDFEYSRVIITSDKMFDDLLNKGVVEHKTLVLQFPSFEIVPKTLMHHFIRGYFDGDGSFSKCIEGYTLPYKVRICGTKEFLQGIENFIGIKGNYSKRHKDDKNNWTLEYSNKEDILQFANTIYEYCTICLNRKYQRYKEMLDQSS